MAPKMRTAEAVVINVSLIGNLRYMETEASDVLDFALFKSNTYMVKMTLYNKLLTNV